MEIRSRECMLCEHFDDLDFFRAYRLVEEKIQDERAEWLDSGKSLVDYAVHIENRLWALEKNKMTKTPEYVAVKEESDKCRFAFSAGYYKEHGWHCKHSGEWVKQEG